MTRDRSLDGVPAPDPDRPPGPSGAAALPLPPAILSPLACARTVDRAHTRIGDLQLALGRTLHILRPNCSGPVLVAVCHVYPMFDRRIDAVEQGLEEIHAALVSMARAGSRDAGAGLPGEDPAVRPTAIGEHGDRARDLTRRAESELTAVLAGISAMTDARDGTVEELAAVEQHIGHYLAVVSPPGADQHRSDPLRSVLGTAHARWTTALDEMSTAIETLSLLTDGQGNGLESKAASSCPPSQPGALRGVQRTGGASSTSSSLSK